MKKYQPDSTMSLGEITWTSWKHHGYHSKILKIVDNDNNEIKFQIIRKLLTKFNNVYVNDILFNGGVIVNSL